MKIYIRATTENHNVFDTSTTNISYYDNFLNQKDLEYMRKNKNRDGEIVMMTPDEYFEYASEIFQHRSSSSDLVKQRSDKYTEQYIEDMKNGDKFPLPYLNFADPGQEGLHRMLAAKRAFGPNVKYPVLVVTVYDQNIEARSILWEEVKKFDRFVFRKILDNLESHISYKYHIPPENLEEIAENYIQEELEFYNDSADDEDKYDVEFDCTIEEYGNGETALSIYLISLNGNKLDTPRQMVCMPFDELFDYEEVQEESSNDYLDDLSEDDLEELFKDDPELYGLLYNN